MSEETNLTMTSILISTFIKQCSRPFNSNMHAILDPDFNKNCVFSKDGYIFVSPDPPGRRPKRTFEKIVTIGNNNIDEERKEKSAQRAEESKVNTERSHKTQKSDIKDFESNDYNSASSDETDNEIKSTKSTKSKKYTASRKIQSRNDSNFDDDGDVDDDENTFIGKEESAKLLSQIQDDNNNNGENAVEKQASSKFEKNNDQDEHNSSGKHDNQDDKMKNNNSNEGTQEYKSNDHKDESENDSDSRKNGQQSVFNDEGDAPYKFETESLHSKPMSRSYKDPNDDEEEQYRELKDLTQELKSITENVADIQIHNFCLKWGITDTDVPFLIDCRGSTFIYSDKLEQFKNFFDQILLFISYESSINVAPGNCINPFRECVGSSMSIIRQKFELYQAQRYFRPLRDLVDVQSLSQYTIERMNIILPRIMMANVPCCQRCFNLFAQVSKSSNNSPKKKTLNRRSITSYSTRHPVLFQPSSRYEQQRHSHTSSIQYNRHQTTNQRTPSGLTYNRSISEKTLRQSHNLYSQPPFVLYRPKP